MRKPSRLAILGLSVVATTALVGGTAGAQGASTGADTFGARANAEALTISIAGTQLTGSKVTADLNQNPESAATASMLLLPGVADSGVLEAKASGVNSPGQTVAPESCPLGDLTDLPGIVRFEVTCPSVTAKVDGALPYARGLGAQLVVEPSVSEILSTLGLQETVTDTVDTVFAEVIDPLVQALTGTPVGELVDETVATVEDVVDDTLTLKSTARIVIAPALAEVTSTADTVTATAHAQGIRVELLPVDEVGVTNGLLPEDLLPGEPLVTITVGDAKAVSKYNRITGQRLEPEATASAVSIEFGSTALTDALGLSAEPITVAPNTEQCVLTGTPLETCVTVAAAGVDADGNPYATSTSIALFRGLNGGIALATGGVTSGSAGSLPQVLPQADLPRTGSSSTLPIVGAGLLAVGVLVRRFIVGRA
jgi:hypothetical protein